MDLQTMAAAYAADTQLQQRANESYNRLLVRSTTDVEFRRKLVNNPRAALAEFNGRAESEFPERLPIRFIESVAKTTIVLPDAIDPAAELSDAELETVAGGITPLCLILCAGAAVTLAAEAINIYNGN